MGSVTETNVKSPSKISDFNVFEHIRYEHLVAGIAGGVTATVILHPLDVIKIRFAVHDGQTNRVPKYNGIFHAFQTIYKEERVKGLYRGVTPNMWGAGTSWGLYFFFYNAIKRTTQNGKTEACLGPQVHLLAASAAGAMTLVITNPIWVCKTRLCLQQGKDQQYKGMIDTLVKIFKNEGVKGYYRGFVPGLLGVSHGAVQFMVYEEMKNQYYFYYGMSITTKLGVAQYLTFAAISKFVAASLTYPYQVVRARLQNQYYSYDGIIDCVSKTITFEGWKGFYKGLGTNLVRVIPATMITFLTYENVSHFLMRYDSKKGL